MEVSNKAIETSGNLRVPFIPVVTARFRMKLAAVVAQFEKHDESAAGVTPVLPL
jgi:hypothetical protein